MAPKAKTKKANAKRKPRMQAVPKDEVPPPKGKTPDAALPVDVGPSLEEQLAQERMEKRQRAMELLGQIQERMGVQFVAIPTFTPEGRVVAQIQIIDAQR